MAQLSSTHSKEGAAGSKDPNYSRKQKSLGLLCSNFLSLYDRDGIDTIGLDDAAARLGVERRRIYDIVNVLESIGVLSKKAKNRYSWKGFGVIPKTLQLLKQEGLKETYTSFDDNPFLKGSDDDEDDLFYSSNNSSHTKKSNPTSLPSLSGSSRTDNRKEKSLGLLTQNFVKLFLCSDVEMISLDDAAKILLGDAHDPSMMRNNSVAKVRRLYDIANVLSSMNFIEKTQHPDTRKPVFKWLGIKGKSQSASVNDLILETKKRMFGTELTNTTIKRSKVVPSINASTDHSKAETLQTQVKCKTIENVVDGNNLERDSGQDFQNYQFGPFAPVNEAKTGELNYNKGKRVYDWESIGSTYRPQYNNQALRDLFGHYMEAWKSWYSEVAGKNPIQILS